MINFDLCKTFEAYVDQNNKQVFEIEETNGLNVQSNAILAIVTIAVSSATRVKNTFRFRITSDDHNVYVSIDNDEPNKADVNLDDPSSVSLTFNQDNFDWTIVLGQ